MKKFLNRKKILFILICMFSIFIVSNYKYYSYEEVKEVSSSKFKNENLLYKRIGSEKAIYDYNIATKNIKKVANLLSDYFYIDNNIGIFYDNINSTRGVYIYNILDNKKDLVLKGYLPISDGKKVDNNIIFLAEGIYRKSSKQLCVYNLDTKVLESKEIEIFKDAHIRDVNIVDGNTFIYSKKIKSIKDSLYKVYLYDFKKYIEEEIIQDDSHVINPILSNNKSKIAYIKKDITTYNLYLLDRKTDKKSVVSLGEGIVGGSVKWSLDDKKLMCITANGGYNDILNIINIEDDSINKLNNIYNATFTSNNKEVIGTSYNIDESLQEIYKINIDTGDKKVIHSFYENGSFSRSVNIREYNSF